MHLEIAEDGVLVSTGTQRSLFDLIFSHDGCEGLVVRDVNSKVKAYIDFVVFLLRISNTVEEFSTLSSTPEDIDQRLQFLQERLDQIPLSESMHSYYRRNLRAFAKVYYENNGFEKPEDERRFSCCRYDQNEDQFRKLQRYARSGNIIATIGDINDLRFLNSRNIAVIDTSNIGNYINLDPQGSSELEKFKPLIIWTRGELRYEFVSPNNRGYNSGNAATVYFSYIHEKHDLSEKEKEHFASIRDGINKYSFGQWLNDISSVPTDNIFRNIHPSTISRSRYKAIQVTLSGIGFTLPGLGFMERGFSVCMYGYDAFFFRDPPYLDRLNHASSEQIQEILVTVEFTESMMSFFINHVLYLKPEWTIEVSKLPGWFDVFKKLSSIKQILFLNKLSESMLLDDFVNCFGKDKLVELINPHRKELLAMDKVKEKAQLQVLIERFSFE